MSVTALWFVRPKAGVGLAGSWNHRGVARALTIWIGHHGKLPHVQDASGAPLLRPAGLSPTGLREHQAPDGLSQKGNSVFRRPAAAGHFCGVQGASKAFISSTDGSALILQIAGLGEVLGLGATVSGKPYELTAETLDPCQVSFVKREDFLRFLKDHTEACFKVAEQLSEKYNHTCREMRSRGLSHSAGEKLARLLLDWSSKNGEDSVRDTR